MTKTRQIDAWRGDFGNAYVDRNQATPDAIRQRVLAWSRVLHPIAGRHPSSILEVGANIGINLTALGQLTGAALYGLEPNARARKALVESGIVAPDKALDGTAQKIPLADGSVDMAFTSGVLIHIHPDDLPAACREMARVSRRYIGVIEYFSHTPVEIDYRGENELLFKRDFGGFLLDQVPGLTVLDYGFFWNRVSGLDNLTWWLFEKAGKSA